LEIALNIGFSRNLENDYFGLSQIVAEAIRKMEIVGLKPGIYLQSDLQLKLEAIEKQMHKPQDNTI